MEDLPYPAKPPTDWINPISVSQLKKALRNKKTLVVLEDREFIIDYRPNRKVFIKIKEGFVPCGHFDIDTVLKEWE